MGLERLLRLVQAVLQILLSYPLLLYLYASLSSRYGRPAPNLVVTRTVLSGLRSRVALARRFFRIFRFLDNFQSAYTRYLALSALSHPPAAGNTTTHAHAHRAHRRRAVLEAYLDILSRSLNGMYLLLESAGLPDALGVEGLAPWGEARAARLHLEAQRFWFLALVFAVAAAVVRTPGIFVVAAATAQGHHLHPPGSQEQQGPKEAAMEAEMDEGGRGGEEKEGGGGDEDDDWDFYREREKLRAIVRQRKEMRVVWRRTVARRSKVLMRRLAADILDLAVPGSVVGWVKMEPGTVAVAMLFSTLLTGWEVWDRCGAEMVGSAT